MSRDSSTTNMFHLIAGQIRSGGCGAVSERRSVMRPRMAILALVMALMLMSMVGMSAIAQDATPQGGEAPEKVNGIDCGRNVPLFDPDALPRPKGVNTVFACAYFATGDNASGGLAIIGTLLTIEPGLVIENPVEGINIRQT